MEQVLFSCVGTTDPVRGEHDGGLLHILRHYRPKAVCIFMTPEIALLDEKDHRYQKMLAHIKQHWDGYAPDLISVKAEVKDASDLDELDKPLQQAMETLRQRYPGAEILINISSGTPQMQMILSQMVLDLRYRTRGIQVKNFERKAGTTERTNSRYFDIDTELELAELEESSPDAPNRCVEPELFPMRREMQWQEIKALLERRDYTAIQSMRGCLPNELMQLVKHLAARNQLQTQEAHKLARGLSLPFSLYPIKPAPGRDSGKYKEISEYFLVMKNLQYTHRYTDFVLRLNPFTIRLQAAALDTALQNCFGYSLSALLYDVRPNHPLFSVDALQAKSPALYQYLCNEFAARNLSAPQNREPSILLYNTLLSWFSEVPGPVKQLFSTCETLNQKRNAAAHQLFNLTDADIQSCINMSCAELVRRIEQAIIQIYPECDPTIFNLYERCEKYIKQNH